MFIFVGMSTVYIGADDAHRYYGVLAMHNAYYTLAGIDLWGDDQYGIVKVTRNWAKAIAVKEENGRLVDLPFDVSISFPAMDINRGVMDLEHLHRQERLEMQVVVLTTVVFGSWEGYGRYMRDNCVFVKSG